MSYDLQVWSVRPAQPEALGKPDIWQRETRAWTHEEKKWQLVVSSSDRVEPEDVPEEAASLLPGIEYLTHLNLEGQAPNRGYKLAQSTANEIARSCHGVVHDPQEDSFRLPSGVKRFAAPRNQEVFDVVALNWWFLNSPLPTTDGFRSFVELVQSLLPEALPKRYGEYEPPQYRYDETGKDHFLKFVHDNAYSVSVWYPHRPFTSVHFSTPNPMGPYQLGFRTGRLSLDIERNVLFQPGWSTNLRRFWTKASCLIQPIYGDVRVLSGFHRHGATVFIQPGHPEHPVKAWWWTGIPKTLGAAVVLGSEYQRVWPEFVAAANVIDGLAFASIDDWAVPCDLTSKVGPPPPDQTQLTSNFPKDDQSYPSGWPLGPKFLPPTKAAQARIAEKIETIEKRADVPLSLKDKIVARLRRRLRDPHSD